MRMPSESYTARITAHARSTGEPIVPPFTTRLGVIDMLGATPPPEIRVVWVSGVTPGRVAGDDDEQAMSARATPRDEQRMAAPDDWCSTLLPGRPARKVDACTSIGSA